MLDSAVRRNLRLPKGWPSRIRSSTVHAISLAHFSLTFARGVAANSINKRIRLRAEVDRLRQEVALLGEELRIKDARMLRIAAQRRPHYPPTERLAILELRAARGWSTAETGRRLLVTPLTVSSWMTRLDDEGPDALVPLPEPVNRFPEFVSYIVRRLKALCPSMGTRKIAQVLCRAGLHLGATTVQRMLAEPDGRRLKPVGAESARPIRSTRPNEAWNVDLTTVPIAGGFWVPWLPWALPQRWPSCWWVAVVVDHFSRRAMGVIAFRQQPSSAAIRAFLDRVVRKAGAAPNYIITDQGRQFVAVGFRRWCRRHNIGQRFGAVGKYGSIAVIERFIRTIKSEATRRMLVPLRIAACTRELVLFTTWYNAHRPHSRLLARTPDEVHFALRPASRTPRFEPRPRWPRSAPYANPHALIRGRPGAQLELAVRFQAGRKHLPIVELRRAA